jgi:hypothetical protein
MMHSRPLPVTAAAILLLLESVTDFPFPWQYLFPGAEDPPWFVVYPGLVLGVAGLIVVYGLWTLKPWSFWTTAVVGVLNFVLAAPGIGAGLPPALTAMIALTAVIAVVIVVLLLPASRQALQRPSAPQPGI